jgi:hypothetical protein
MSEAKQLHDDLLNALLPLIPRRAYQDIHRLNTLVWAVTGLCLTHTVRLGAWAEILESRAQYAASRVRRFSRWLHHPAISPPQWYRPLLQAALVDWPLDQRLSIAPSHDSPHPFCADPCLPGVSRSRHLCSMASLASSEHASRF